MEQSGSDEETGVTLTAAGGWMHLIFTPTPRRINIISKFYFQLQSSFKTQQTYNKILWKSFNFNQVHQDERLSEQQQQQQQPRTSEVHLRGDGRPKPQRGRNQDGGRGGKGEFQTTQAHGQQQLGSN